MAPVAVVLWRQRRRGRSYRPRFCLSQSAVTSLGALCALLLLGLLSIWSHQVLIVAPLGASSVLLFGYPRSPLAQPLNLVLGNGLGALVGVLLGQWPGGIMSAIDFTLTVDQQPDPKGDRVVVTMNGKFLPYKTW